MNRIILPCPCKSKKLYLECCAKIAGCNFKELYDVMKLENISDPVFRNFNKKEYALDFYSGKKIRISTLQCCRKLENASARDENEGKLSLWTSPREIDKSNSKNHSVYVDDLKYTSGIELINCENISIGHSTRTSPITLPNAYVLCTSNSKSEYLKKIYGKFCIKINQPYLFSYYVFLKLRNLNNVQQLIAKKLDYDENPIDINNTNIISNIGFKKHLKFKPEDEFRMLFHSSADQYINPVFVKVPEIKKLCEFIELN